MLLAPNNIGSHALGKYDKCETWELWQKGKVKFFEDLDYSALFVWTAFVVLFQGFCQFNEGQF